MTATTERRAPSPSRAAARWLGGKVDYRPVYWALRWRAGWVVGVWWLTIFPALATFGWPTGWGVANGLALATAGWFWRLSDREPGRRARMLVAGRWARACIAAHALPRLAVNQPVPATGLRYPSLRDVRISHGGNVEATVALPGGMTYEQLKALTPAIGAWYQPQPLAFDVAPGEDIRHATVTVTHWRAFDGQSTEPFPYDDGQGVAVDEKGENVYFDVPGHHVLIAGQSDAGKSSWVNAIVAVATDDHPNDPEVWGIDLKGLELGRLVDLMTRVALTPAEADDLLDAAIGQLDARIKHLTGKDRSWTKGCGFRPLMIVVDELSQVVWQAWPGEDQKAPKARLAKLVRLGAMGRALGIQLVVATQNPLAETVGRIRDNCQLVVCCWVRGSNEARVVLGDDLGMELRPWGLTLQGSAWVVGKKRKPYCARARWLDDATVATIAAAHQRPRPTTRQRTEGA